MDRDLTWVHVVHNDAWRMHVRQRTLECMCGLQHWVIPVNAARRLQRAWRASRALRRFMAARGFWHLRAHARDCRERNMRVMQTRIARVWKGVLQRRGFARKKRAALLLQNAWRRVRSECLRECMAARRAARGVMVQCAYQRPSGMRYRTIVRKRTLREARQAAQAVQASDRSHTAGGARGETLTLAASAAARVRM